MSKNESQIASAASPQTKISRREIARMFLAAAPALTLPGVSSAHPVWRHLADDHLLDGSDLQLSSANWRPFVLTHSQEQSLHALTEAIVPGSTKALSSRFIDLLLSVETQTTQQKFLGSLAALENESSKQFGKSLRQLSPQELNRFLTNIASTPRSSDVSSILHGHFEDLKEWIAAAYYSSEIGMRELGWTPDRVFSSFPGCSHSEEHSL